MLDKSMKCILDVDYNSMDILQINDTDSKIKRNKNNI